MKLRLRILELRLRHVFSIARGAHRTAPVVLVELERDGIVGRGEVCPSSYHGQTCDTVLASLESIAPWLESRDPEDFQTLLLEADERMGRNSFALCGLDLALHDWIGRRLGLPLHRLLGLSPRVPPTSYTIGMDAIPSMIAKLREFPDFARIKIKLGGPDDLEIARAIRAETAATLSVDANCGWTPEETLAKTRELANLGVEFVEQPLPRERLEEMPALFRESALPLFADESFRRPEDAPGLAGRFHGLNIKLVKCGGIQGALRAIATGRALGFRLMIGCMLDSSLPCTAAAHLGSLVDHLDVDGPLLLEEDPFRGMTIERDGSLRLPRSPGIGCEPA